MPWGDPRSAEAKITRLSRELAELDHFFYRSNEHGDRSLYAGMLERKRDDFIRSAVLQIQTAIEDLINTGIWCRVLNIAPDLRMKKMRSAKAKALRKILYDSRSLGFDAKLNFAVALGILNSRTRDKLAELNSLRNKCSHNWLLKAPRRRGRRPKQTKPPLLEYQGADLYKVATFKAFSGEYGAIYAKLFLKCL